MSGPYVQAATALAHVDALAWLDAYEAMNVHQSYGWYATRESYDGAPDSNYPCGHSFGSKYEAIADLLEQEWERAS